MREERLECLRECLNQLLESDNISLYKGEILELSERLDKLICAYYELEGMLTEGE